MPTIAMYSVWLLHSKEKAMKPKSWKQGLSRTTENYASRTSIHGISYIFDWDLSFADRLFWTIFTLSFLALAILLTWNNWTQWQENQVKTGVQQPFVWAGEEKLSEALWVLNDWTSFMKTITNLSKTCHHIIQVYLNDVTASYIKTHIWCPQGQSP